MFKLGYRTLVSRKKWFFLIVITLSMIVASIISISTASESIKMGMKEQAYLDYGKHTLVLLDTSETKETLYKNKEVEHIGGIDLLGNFELNNGYKATVGTIDKQARELGKITLLEGSFPKKKNEVAIESSYLSLIDNNWMIGEKKIVKIDNTEIELELSGIINDYSAKWAVPHDVQKGINDFPNIVLSKDNELETKYRNFLVQLNGPYGKIDKMHKKASTFLEGQVGFFNERLFYNGLANYRHITMLSFIFQLITLIASFLCMFCLLYFFNITQQKKLSIFKAVGSTNLKLLKLILVQILILLLTGFLLSLPLQYFLHIWIIQNTFNISNLDFSNVITITMIVAIWIIVLFCITFFSSYLSLNRIKNRSINELLKGLYPNKSQNKKISLIANNFMVNKVINQLLTNPKHSILVIFTLTLSILILTFSIFVEKESTGIWDAKVDYYLNSQEIYGFDVVDNLTVLLQEGLTFPPNKVKQIEEMAGIDFVEKTPFMVDIHPFLNENLVTTSIRNWFNQNKTNPNAGTYKQDYIIPNVKYILVDKEQFIKLYPNLTYENLLEKVILYNPAYTKSADAKKLNGQTITLVQKKQGNHKSTEWNFEILEMINSPFNFTISDSLHFQYSEFIIVMAKETAIEQGLLTGYNELSIYLKERINREEIKAIESELNKLTALTPGSLYQNISTFIEDDKRISVFVGYLGKLTYGLSVVLSILCTTVIVFSKYRLMKKEWGIYLSLGMRKKEVNKLLYLEMIIYLFIATVLSLMIFTLTQLLDNLYPYFFYIQYFYLSILIILFLITIGWFVIVNLIKKQSIYSLIREED
ncbi:FtsX-like permease family protein [Paraliobacillus sp. JSM ZJ581]|uniref:FtsX-like permease family protein n=1 Tax=Paraliobacillus sp. JSM ZJ581 TaxID=3342118 RepID=UPI0035A8DB56